MHFGVAPEYSVEVSYSFVCRMLHHSLRSEIAILFPIQVIFVEIQSMIHEQSAILSIANLQC